MARNYADTYSVTTAAAGPRTDIPQLRVFTASGSFDVALGDGTWMVGRGRDAHVRIDDHSVSRTHARLQMGERVWLEDLGSANGTRVAGRALEKKKPVLVADGMAIEFGDVLAVLHMGTARGFTLVSAGAGDGSRDLSSDGSDAKRVLLRIARADLPVLIEGETGAGKDHTAAHLHACSKRSAGPLVRVSCAQVRAGRLDLGDVFTRAASGSLLLDEIADLDADGQALLVGAWESSLAELGPAACARIVSMSSRRVEDAALSGAFRRDLYYRLAHLTLQIPPLRSRTSELADITSVILNELSTAQQMQPPLLSADALRTLQRYAWPGNVRELRAALERALIVSNPRVLTASHFQDLGARVAMQQTESSSTASGTTPVASGERERAPAHQSLKEAAESAEYERILEVLRSCNGNQTRAAKILGISRGTLIVRLERYNVPRPRKL